MEQKERCIFITDNLTDIYAPKNNDFLGHSLCTDGSCRIWFNGKELQMAKGDLMIVRRGKLIEKIKPDSDFKVTTIMISPQLIELSTPQSNYGMKGQLALQRERRVNAICHHDEQLPAAARKR